MVTFEYNILGEHHSARIPTSLSELTIRELTELSRLGEEQDRLKYISILGGVDYNHLALFDDDSKRSLINATEFLFHDVVLVKDMKGLEYPPIGKLQLNQFEHWRKDPSLVNTVALLHSGDYSYSSRMDNIEYYYSLPADIALYCREFYNKEFANHIKKFGYLYERYEPTAEESIAGYDELANWGVYSTYAMLAGDDIFKMQEASKLPVDDAYYFMLYQKTKNEYQKKLSDAILRSNRNR